MDSKLNVALSQAYIKLFAKNRHISDARYNRHLYFLRTGKKANLQNPKTFNEHVLARKVFADESNLAQFTDKYAARAYVAQTIGEAYLVKNLGVWESAEAIEPERLPKRFILKGTHGSGWNVIVRDRDSADWTAIREKLASFLRQNYYFKSRERNYRDIQPRIVCEELLTPESEKGLVDFKVFCFRGSAKFFSIAYQTGGQPFYGLYLKDGSRIPIKSRYRGVDEAEILPQREKLLSLAERLAKPFEFVRVDFYLCDSNVYFSELTFHSGGGIRPIEPAEIDRMLGKFFEETENET